MWIPDIMWYISLCYFSRKNTRWKSSVENLQKIQMSFSNHNERKHKQMGVPQCWWVKYLSPVPVHAVGLPYRLASRQDQDSLRVLQYVENQLAQFNPARSISHQCKLHKPILWLHANTVKIVCGMRSLDTTFPIIPFIVAVFQFFSACLCMPGCTEAFCLLHLL